MSDLSKKTLISSGDTKNYIENYWTKRADAFAALRRQELHSEKYSQWQRGGRTAFAARKTAAYP